jgi:UDPglucose--hexose-1-phosphate uridylyltransferase
MIFENRGEVVGVTMPHPHGQIYAYPFLPKKVEMKHDSARKYLTKTDRCLFCDWLKAEHDFQERVIFDDEHFSVIIPFFAEFAFQTQIISKKHKKFITELTDEERTSLARTVRNTVGMYDSLFDMPFPYMMCMYNAPVNTDDIEGFHFHIEFFPPMRSKEKQQFLASSETGAGAHCNPTAPEEKAVELREAYLKYIAEATE